MHGLGVLGAAAALEVVVDMEVSSMVQHMGHGLVETVLERLNGAEVLEVRMSQDVFLGQFLWYHFTEVTNIIRRCDQYNLLYVRHVSLLPLQEPTTWWMQGVI